jgi:HSP20 family molecular chaperone IbpA
MPLVPCDPDATVPYNLESFGGSRYRLTLGAPGFTERDIEVFAEGGFLRIIGQSTGVRAAGNSLHQGLRSSVRHTFLMLEPVNVIATQVDDGLVRVDLETDALAAATALVPPNIWQKVGELGLAA